MIFEAVCDIIFDCVFVFFDAIPLLHLDIPSGALESFITILDIAAYFLPMNTIVVMLSIILAEEGLKIGVAMLRFIWKFIPFIGA